MNYILRMVLVFDYGKCIAVQDRWCAGTVTTAMPRSFYQEPGRANEICGNSSGNEHFCQNRRSSHEQSFKIYKDNGKGKQPYNLSYIL